MNIKPEIYENLTARQRVIATLEAEARNDQDEVAKLVRTCPHKTYSQTDAAYSDTLNSLKSFAMAHEADLRACALRYVLLTMGNSEHSDFFIQNLADSEGAWSAILAQFGIESETARSALMPRDPIVAELLLSAPAPDPEGIKENLLLLYDVASTQKDPCIADIATAIKAAAEAC